MEILEKISGIIKNYGNGGNFLKFINMVKSSYGVLALFGYGKNKDGDVIPSIIDKQEAKAFGLDSKVKSALSRRGIDSNDPLGQGTPNNQSLIERISSIMKNKMGKDFYGFIEKDAVVGSLPDGDDYRKLVDVLAKFIVDGDPFELADYFFKADGFPWGVAFNLELTNKQDKLTNDDELTNDDNKNSGKGKNKSKNKSKKKSKNNDMTITINNVIINKENIPHLLGLSSIGRAKEDSTELTNIIRDSNYMDYFSALFSHFFGPSGKKNRDDFLKQTTTSGKVDNVIRIALKKAALVLFLNEVFLSVQDSKLVPNFYLYSENSRKKPNQIGDSFILLSQIYPKNYYIGLIFNKITDRDDPRFNHYVLMSVHVARGMIKKIDNKEQVLPPDMIGSFSKVHPNNKNFFLRSLMIKTKTDTSTNSIDSQSENPPGHGRK